jgi:hypothetical protein
MVASAQDQFAKWAKLKRSMDRGFQDLERQVSLCITSITHAEPVIILSDSEIASVKTKFSIKFNSALWFMPTGLQFLVHEIRCVLSTPRLVRSFDLVVGSSLGSF